MFSLMEGRHVHPSTLYPGGVGTVPSVQLFSEYMIRLSRYTEFVKRMVGRGYTERQVRRLVEWYMRVKQAG